MDGKLYCPDASIIVNNMDATGDCYATINKDYILDSVSDISDEFRKKLENYENQLQRKTPHIGRGEGITGRPVHGRRCKITVRKGSFRNKKGISSNPIYFG